MFQRAYAAQCAVPVRFPTEAAPARGSAIALFALAFGTFGIGTGEFGSMGVLQLFSSSLGVDIPQATNAIAAYAFGVMLGSPVVAVAAAKLHRRTLLLCLMGLFVFGNVLSSLAPNFGTLLVARFIAGMPQGAYFGAGAVVASYFFGPKRAGKAFALVMSGLTVATIVGSPLATFLGQHLGWRNTYLSVAGLGELSFLALYLFIPRADALRGRPVLQELSALRKPNVWLMMGITSLGIASIFAVYTFIGPFITDVNRLPASWIPIALALFGIGMTVGNQIGGHLADTFQYRGLVLGYALTLVIEVLLALFGARTWVLMPALFGMGATTMCAIPTIQVRLTNFAPDAPSLVGALNLSALNFANILGAWGGGITIAAGYGFLSAAWAGFALTLAGLVLFALTFGRRGIPALSPATPT